MEFTPGHLQKLAELLTPPEQDVLQGDDYIPTIAEKILRENVKEGDVNFKFKEIHSRDIITTFKLLNIKSNTDLWDYEIISTKKENAGAQNTKNLINSIEEYEQQEVDEVDLLSKSGGGMGDRKTPSYTMNYQQSVGAEDIFLQIGHKTPSSASCENLIVRIQMSGDKKENIDLSVETSRITVDSSQYHLKFSPPHPVDPDRSKANWDAAEETLILTLKLNREFDFVNF